MKWSLLALCAAAPLAYGAQDQPEQRPGIISPTSAALAPVTVEKARPNYSIHYQSTVIDQGHPRFHANYSGPNSFQSYKEADVSVTSTFFLGWQPWRGTSFFWNPELSGGQGMSGAFGISGFPNGETYRIGNPQPVLKTARLYAQQVIGFTEETERVEDGINQVAGVVPKERLTLTGGKFGMMDWFDNNAYSHDPRSQFMNWNLANSGAWDYPADTFGYTWGAVAEYHTPVWAARGAAVAEPEVANQIKLDRRVGKSHGFVLEGEHQADVDDHKGTVRLLMYFNQAHMGNYDEAIARAQTTGTTPDVTASRSYAHTKYGFTSSDDLQLTETLGWFTRLSWSDGHNESWAYTECDGSLATGLDWTAAAFDRPKDHWGFAELVDVLSTPHRRYLANGGLGFQLGDGSLHYGPEVITETYYSIQVREWFKLSPDLSLLVNPGYNRDRGPVAIYGLRAHVEF
ncbi:MAG: carbohydrate porin [Elusimicrobiota bacterium]